MKYLLLILSFNVLAMSDAKIDSMPMKKARRNILRAIDKDLLLKENSEGKSICYRAIGEDEVEEPCPDLTTREAAFAIWKEELKEIYRRKRDVKNNSRKLFGKLRKGDTTKAEMQIIMLKMIQDIELLRRKLK